MNAQHASISGRSIELDLAAEYIHPADHIRYSDAGALTGAVEAFSIVFYPDVQPITFLVEADVDTGGICIFYDIVQLFLYDPVNGDL